jgi:hypothetical protein
MPHTMAYRSIDAEGNGNVRDRIEDTASGIGVTRGSYEVSEP